MLKLTDFDYNLSKELIAQYPLKEREDARLLVLEKKSGSISHYIFKQISDFLNKDELLVLNDTKVLSCRLIGKKATGGKVEALLIKRNSGTEFEAMVNPTRTKNGEKIFFDSGRVIGTVAGRGKISFKQSDADSIYNIGQVPLPPYIKREPEEKDKEYYQTVYALNEGAIASPTAGLHFTGELLKEIQAKGVDIAYLTLHVGIGTFKPVVCEDVVSHKMEKEYFQIPESTVKKIEEARINKKRIIAVGTTSLRALESYASGTRGNQTDLFIYPGFKFKLTDGLLTNFHLPRTTLFMLVCAFAGTELAKKAYQEAIEQKYRFYSYGDAMLII